MEIIPVIDLKGGEVVHARRGERAGYRPIATPLARGSDPLAVVEGLMRLSPFATLYIADLDAIGGGRGHGGVIRSIARAWPGLEIWTDCGSASVFDVAEWRGRGFGRLVLGSESQRSSDLVALLRGAEDVVLSLDFRGEDFQGPAELLEQPELWPRRVIVMTLARVGSAAGPDLARLGEVMERAAGRQVYAAGGLRDVEDGLALKRSGVAGVLAATALHEGRLSAADILRLA